MARPRLHHTPEAKAAADHAKWHRYYAKYFFSFPCLHIYLFLYRNRESICRRSRAKYQKFTNPSEAIVLGNHSWQIDSIKKEHSKITRSNLAKYLSDIYSEYCSKPSTSTITDALTPIESLCDTAHSLQNDILRKDGLGLDWKKAEEVCKELRKTRSMIEDLLCYALLGLDEVKEAYRNGVLNYQNISWMPYYYLLDLATSKV
jgi:hypothetical protein